MDSNDKIQKVTAKAAALDCSRAMEEVYLKIKKEILQQLESKNQRVRHQVADMRVKVMERRGHLNLLRERLRSREELVRSKRQSQAQLVIALENEKIRREKLVKSYEEIRGRMQATWNEYLEIYNKFPLARKKAELENKLKLLQFQNNHEAQKRKDKQQVIDQMRQMKQLIRESRERQMANLRVRLEKDKDRVEELSRVKEEKLELIARLAAEKTERERERKQLAETFSTGTGRPLPLVIPPTLEQTTMPTFGLSPVLSQMSQLPRSQNRPSSCGNTVMMSFNRRIIEERCLVVVSPRQETTFSHPTLSTANPRNAQHANTTDNDSAAVTGLDSIDELMEVQAEKGLVDLEYGGSDSSQNSAKNSSSLNTIAETPQRQIELSCPSQMVQERSAGRADFPELAAMSSSSVDTQISGRNIQSQSLSRSAKLFTCTTSSQSRSGEIHPTPEPLHNNDRGSEKMARVTPSPSVANPTIHPSPVNTAPLSPIRPVASDTATTRASSTPQNFASPSLGLTHQIKAPVTNQFVSATPCASHQIYASTALHPAHQNISPPAHYPTHQNTSAPALSQTQQNIASLAPTPLQHSTPTASPERPIQQNLSLSSALSSIGPSNSTLPMLRPRVTSPALSASESSNSLKSATQTSRFHPYGPIRYPTVETTGNTTATSLGVRASSSQPSTYPATQGSLPSAFQNPTTNGRSVSSQPQPVRPAHGSESISVRMEQTSPAPQQASTDNVSSLAIRVSPSPIVTERTAPTPMFDTAQQAASNIRKPEDSSTEGEKSQYFDQRPTNGENRQAAIVNIESGKPEKVVSPTNSNSDQGNEISESGQDFNLPGYDFSDMGDELTSPPMPKEDDVELSSSPRRFTSPISDFETADPANEPEGSTFGFSSLWSNAAGKKSSGQAQTSSPFSFIKAPSTNIFKLF